MQACGFSERADVSRGGGSANGPGLAERLADRAETCLHRELASWPKPGLVSHIDQGSHTDMDAATFARSAAAIRPYFAELAAAGASGAGMQPLRQIGLAAEAAMRQATGGVNTHRGAIFGLGLLCAAAGARAAQQTVQCRPRLGQLVADRWGAAILAGPRPADSHGENVRQVHGAGGAREEAALGFPSAYRIGLPALRAGRRLAPGDPEAARIQACFALIACLEDTNLLHRGGAAGLAHAQRAATGFLARGGVAQENWRADAAAIHRDFIARNLSPGGAADLLAISLFLQYSEEDETGAPC